MPYAKARKHAALAGLFYAVYKEVSPHRVNPKRRDQASVFIHVGSRFEGGADHDLREARS